MLEGCAVAANGLFTDPCGTQCTWDIAQGTRRLFNIRQRLPLVAQADFQGWNRIQARIASALDGQQLVHERFSAQGRGNQLGLLVLLEQESHQQIIVPPGLGDGAQARPCAARQRNQDLVTAPGIFAQRRVALDACNRLAQLLARLGGHLLFGRLAGLYGTLAPGLPVDRLARSCALEQ